MDDLFDRLQPLRDGALTALKAFDAANAQSDGLLGIATAAAAVLVVVLSIPTGRGQAGAVWPRLWACGALGGLAAVMVFIPR